MRLEGKLEVETPWPDNPMPYLRINDELLFLELEEFDGKEVIITVTHKPRTEVS